MKKIWLAPAKINLFLHITGQREDGYHELQTVFQFLDYADELRFDVRDDGEIVLETPLPGVADKDNLVVKAARLLQQQSGCPEGAHIHISKKLPMGGGLGGGSSDAATTLVALNQLWNINFEKDELARLGLALGADVPVFVQGYAAWAEGVGENLSPIKLDEPWYVVLIPEVSVSTAKIFASDTLKRNCTPLDINRFLAGEGDNVCEEVVCQQYPEVAEAIQWLSQFASARMTGTGACVFAPVESEAQAQEILQHKPAQIDGFYARSCNISPLYSQN